MATESHWYHDENTILDEVRRAVSAPRLVGYDALRLIQQGGQGQVTGGSCTHDSTLLAGFWEQERRTRRSDGSLVAARLHRHTETSRIVRPRCSRGHQAELQDRMRPPALPNRQDAASIPDQRRDLALVSLVDPARCSRRSVRARRIRCRLSGIIWARIPRVSSGGWRAGSRSWLAESGRLGGSPGALRA